MVLRRSCLFVSGSRHLLSKYSEYGKCCCNCRNIIVEYLYRTCVCCNTEGQWSKMTKDQYIEKIVALLEQCNDIPLLDLIFRLLRKSLN